jgi:hypothetical protein
MLHYDYCFFINSCNNQQGISTVEEFVVGIFPWYVVILGIKSKEYRLVTSVAEVREIRETVVVFDDGSTFDLATNTVQDMSTAALEETVLVDPRSVFYINPVDLVNKLSDRTVIIGIMPDGTIVMHKLYESAHDAFGLTAALRQIGSAV